MKKVAKMRLFFYRSQNSNKNLKNEKVGNKKRKM